MVKHFGLFRETGRDLGEKMTPDGPTKSPALRGFLILAQGDLGVYFAGEVQSDLDCDEECGAAEDERGNARKTLDD